MRYSKATCLANIVVLLLLVVLHPLNPFTSFRPYRLKTIPDKVVVPVVRQLTADSIDRMLRQTKSEIAEMDYYLRVHNVTDEGYNQVARYNTQLQLKYRQLRYRQQHSVDSRTHRGTPRRIAAKDRPLVAVKMSRGYWKSGHYHVGPLSGKGLVRDYQGRVLSAVWDADTIVSTIRTDSIGVYRGQVDGHYLACGQGVMDYHDGCHIEGLWRNDRIHGFAFDSSPLHPLQAGQWKNGRFLGERLRYTTDRIYGIDISRHQHEKGRRRYAINWQHLRITSLGKRHPIDTLTFPVSFVYIKATEGTNIRNRYYRFDYLQAIRTGIHVGAYHFFSLKSPAEAQARFFLGNAGIRHNDFPPVLDVEPTDDQIRKIGGDEELLRRIRIWLQMVEQRTGKRPILYVNQMFVNRHMQKAADIKQKYNVWIARYGEYKPDVKLVYWQLCADGRVSGIHGDVDINVFNGYQAQYDKFVRTGFHQ